MTNPEPLIERVKRLANAATLRAQITSEIMRLLPGNFEPVESRPTIEELEKILASDNGGKITINPDGSIGTHRPAKVGDIADAVLVVIGSIRTDAPRMVERYEQALAQLRAVQKLISEAAMTGFNWQDGDWPQRLFESQQQTSAVLQLSEEE